MEELVSWKTRDDVLRLINRNAERQAVSRLEAESEALIAHVKNTVETARQ
jgi:hypothetical protein